MEENKNLKPEQELLPEDRLDQLLAEFLAAPDMELPPIPAREEPEYESAFFFDGQAVPDKEHVDSEPLFVAMEHPVVPESEEIAPPQTQALPLQEIDEDVDILPILDMDAVVFSSVLLPSEPEPEVEPSTEQEAEVSTEPESLPPVDAEPVYVQECIAEMATDDADILPVEVLSIGESLASPAEAEEIGVDEQALEAAGLTTVEPEEQPTDPDAPEEPTASIPMLISSHIPENPEDKESQEMTDPVNETQEGATPEEEEYIPPRKIRPKKKGAYGFLSIPHMAAVAIWLAIIVFVGVGLGNILWEYASDMLAFGRESKTATITISPNDDLDDICRLLKNNGLIKYPGLFKIYANLTDAMEDIKPGTYTLNTLYDYMALKRSMSENSARVTTKVVIPEGYTTKQIFALLETKGVSTVVELEEAAANAELGEYWFLEGVDRSVENCLEGYLFPDTYEFYLNHDATGVLQKFLDNFETRFNDTMKANLVTLNETLAELMRKNGKSEDYIAQHQMTVREVVIIASMIEKETANTSESFTISSVIYNRLTNPDAYPHLQIDATLVYLTGNNKITDADREIESPYNTYKYPGLIPGPICNPSRASMDAALEPAYDDTHEDGSLVYYYFYAFNPAAGEHKFSETLAEHDAFLESLKQNNEETE